jgi:hypothetical protein
MQDNNQLKEKKIIIGLSGKKGVGKSTVAEYIEETYDFREYAFANKLKDACMLVFQLSMKQLYGTQSDKESIDEFWGISPRVIMQEFGTAMRNLANKNEQLDRIWIRGLHREIELKGSKLVVISDVRYQDEADSIKEYENRGWKTALIKIVRPEVELEHAIMDAANTDNDVDADVKSNGEQSTAKHESETQDVKCDYEIVNSRTRKVLFDNIKKIIDTLLKEANE